MGRFSAPPREKIERVCGRGMTGIAVLTAGEEWTRVEVRRTSKIRAHRRRVRAAWGERVLRTNAVRVSVVVVIWVVIWVLRES